MIEVPQEISTKVVREFMTRHGADLVGVAPIERFPADGTSRDPRIHMRRVRTVVAFARRVAFSSATPYPSVASLQFGDFTLEHQLNELAYEASLWLENGGEMTMPMPAGRDIVSFEVLQRPPEEPKISLKGSFDLRYAGVVCGIGQIGANGLLINQKYGSRIRLCAILTTAVLEPDAGFEYSVTAPKFCEDCGYRCIARCPAQALHRSAPVDQYRCLAIRPEMVNPAQVLGALEHDLRGTPIILAAKQLSYTTSAPHTCSTCTTQCPMDQGRLLAKHPFAREEWSEDDFVQAASYPERKDHA